MGVEEPKVLVTVLRVGIGQDEIQMLSWSRSTSRGPVERGFFGSGAGEERAMEECHVRLSARLLIATGKRLASLLFTWTKSIPS